MNKKSVFGLLLFGCSVIFCLFAGVYVIIGNSKRPDANQNQFYFSEEGGQDNTNSEDTQYSDSIENSLLKITGIDILTEEPWLSANPSDPWQDTDTVLDEEEPADAQASRITGEGFTANAQGEDTDLSVDVISSSGLQIIYDSRKVDYLKYVPEIICDSKLEEALDIPNPKLSITAKSAILFNAETKEVLYHKNPVIAKFPASTAKLLTALVVLEWCYPDEEVSVGEEAKMMAPDSTRAYLRPGHVLTVYSLLEGMLLPSGNDAAYIAAVYVGRKSLQSMGATKEEAVEEFMRLANEKARKLGIKNSSFKTPDGYDAIGQYTTAYDMGLIGIAAAQNEIIVEISKKSRTRSSFIRGGEVTWNNTNHLVNKGSGWYYSNAIGLKTGTSTMAGRCLVAAAEKDGKKVVCVILDASTTAGRWEDAKALLAFGLK